MPLDMDFALFNDVLFKAKPHEYNGYNKRLNREAGMSPAHKSAIVYLPLINMKACDPTTILTSTQGDLKSLRAQTRIFLFSLAINIFIISLLTSPSTYQNC